jgi:hypothetical protein
MVCQQHKTAYAAFAFPFILYYFFQVGKAQLRIPASMQFVDMELLQKESACLALLLGSLAGGDGGSMGLLPVESLAFSHILPPAVRTQEVLSTPDLSNAQTLKSMKGLTILGLFFRACPLPQLLRFNVEHLTHLI